MFDVQFNRRALLGAGAIGAVAALIGCSGGSAEAATGRFEVMHTPADWKKRLGAARFNILRNAGTETPFTSPLNNEHRKGVFSCASCALPLYSSTTKFDSGTGWPSFYAALPNAAVTSTDKSLLMTRVEEHCRRCGGHLGHVFDDGPRPTGKRHCINGLALTFKPA